MRINTNVAALNSYNQLKNTQSNLSKSLERLSSGKRINRAADDAAGLAISEKMKAQINGLSQAQRNAQDSISMIQTAEGALKETHSILQRMRELSIQSANDTNTAADREEIQKEVDQLNAEVNRIANNTEFNTKKLLNGDSGAKVNFASNANVDVASATPETKSGSYAVVTTTAAEQATSTGAAIAFSAVASGSKTVEINGNSISFDFDNTDAASTATNFKNAVNNANIGVTVTGDNTGLDLSTDDYGSEASLTITASAVTSEMGLTTDATTDTTDVGVDVAGTIGGATASGKGVTLTGTGDAKGLEVKLTTTAAASTAGARGNVDVTQNSLSTQIGANAEQTMTISMSSMGSSDLGVQGIDVTSEAGAQDAIKSLDDAIANVSAERSKLGAYQNRLDHTINNLNTAEENLTAAESRISDVDMAKEMMAFTKNQILSQAGTAMMAQANQLPQGVLQLLG